MSVVVPTYNRGDLVRASATSVLNQRFGDLELLIVDDGSSEDLGAALGAVLEDPRVKLLRHDKNRGTAAARNTGASLARGNHIAFLDSDDVWYSDKLLRQLAWMKEKGRAISCTGYRLVTPLHPSGEQRLSRDIGFHDLQWGCGISPGSTMVASRALFEAIGPFDETLRRLEDWEWLLRCSQATPISLVPEILALVQISAREPYPWEHIRDSAAIIENYVLEGKYPLRSRGRRILRSTLHSEVAAAAFRRGCYGSAFLSLLRSLYYYPFKRMGYYHRILRAAKSDAVAFASRIKRPASRDRKGT